MWQNQNTYTLIIVIWKHIGFEEQIKSIRIIIQQGYLLFLEEFPKNKMLVCLANSCLE